MRLWQWFKQKLFNPSAYSARAAMPMTYWTDKFTNEAHKKDAANIVRLIAAACDIPAPLLRREDTLGDIFQADWFGGLNLELHQFLKDAGVDLRREATVADLIMQCLPLSPELSARLAKAHGS